MASKRNTETMEEVMNSIKHACELARNLESELPNMANQPGMLCLSIDDVVQAFNGAKERVLMMMMMLSQQDQTITASSSFAPMLSSTHDATQQAQMGATTSMHEWLSYMDQFKFNQMQQTFDVRALIENKMIDGVDLQQLRYDRSTLQIGEMGGRDVEGSARSKGSGGDHHVKKIEASSSSRPRKSSRKNDTERKTMTVPAPQIGNTEMPPEDGFTWRKYGQKEILGSKYPRSYYRCTHQKLYACPAKKQVQKFDHNPNIFEVTYRGEHTCHMSSTAPSSFHPPQLLLDHAMTTQTTISPQLSPPSSTSVSGWLSSANLSLFGGGGMASTGAGGASSSADPPSTSKYATDYLVADMADVMFNSRSSSGNDSMETLFPPTEDKWDPSEKKS